MIILYTDASSKPHSKMSSWAFVLDSGEQDSGIINWADINNTEILAVIKGLEYVNNKEIINKDIINDKDIVIYTDSLFVIELIRGHKNKPKYKDLVDRYKEVSIGKYITVIQAINQENIAAHNLARKQFNEVYSARIA